jgi:hypothetical protein
LERLVPLRLILFYLNPLVPQDTRSTSTGQLPFFWTVAQVCATRL